MDHSMVAQVDKPHMRSLAKGSLEDNYFGFSITIYRVRASAL